jgi:hypothetical protein
MKVLMDFGESAHFLSRGPKVPNNKWPWYFLDTIGYLFKLQHGR